MPADDNLPEGPISRDAAQWLARHDRGLTPAEELAFARWYEADSRHAAAYEQLRSHWQEFESAKFDPELARMARELEEQTRVRPDATKTGWRPVFTIAAAAAIALCGAFWTWRKPATEPAPTVAGNYRVIPNQVRRLQLEDGSAVELRGESTAIHTEFTQAERRVTLLRGEAFFAVAKNPERPFIVTAGRTMVRAVGTAFNVQLDAAAVSVVVTEGKVLLAEVPSSARASGSAAANAERSTPLLVGGQCAIIAQDQTGASATPKVVSLTPAELDETLAWQSTWLVFDETPLVETVAAFNRHGSGHLVLGDPSLHGRRLTGKFRADHIDGFIRLLERTMSVRAERRGEHEIVLVPEP